MQQQQGNLVMAKRSQQNVFRGGPEHGSRFDEPADEFDDEFEDDEFEDEDDEPINDNQPDELAALRAENDRLRQQNEVYRSQTPPPAPKPAPTEEEVDWEELLFRDPKAALDLRDARLEKKLRSQYTQDQSDKEFWADFYKKHKDLSGEDDLVKMTMQSHFAEIGNLPVAVAMDKLADLTRERIMRYSGKPRARKKGQAEGATAPAPPRRVAPPDEGSDKVTTMADVLRRRRLKRMGGNQAA